MLAKSKLSSIEVLLSKDLIDKLVLINVLKEFDDMNEEIKNSNK